jgi:hypothetical protein
MSAAVTSLRDRTYDATTSARVADQQHVGHPADPAPVDAREQVMGHVLLVEHLHAGGHGPEQAVHHGPPVGLAGGDDLVPAGVVDARGVEVVGVQRLVDDQRVAPVLPRPHERGRHVAGAGPDGQPQHVPRRGGHASQRPPAAAAEATSRSTASR